VLRASNAAAMPTDDADASWDARLLPLLSDQWQSAEALAARAGGPHHTVLARLKDLLRRNLAERRIVKHPTKSHAGRPLQQAEFRRMRL